MKFYLISDNTDTYMGMRLSGIQGVVVHEKQELLDALAQVVDDSEVGIVLITEKLTTLCPDAINDFKLHRKKPLIATIPDRHGGSVTSMLERYVSEAIGVKM